MEDRRAAPGILQGGHMTHVPKSLWPTAFIEGKRVAEAVHSANRKMKKFTKADPEEPPTDRELALGACVMVFWAYKVSQEANAAARKLTLLKAERFFERFHTEGEDFWR